jgi:hypothetical protein
MIAMSRMGFHSRIRFGSILALLAFSSCSFSKDALVINPCDVPLRVWLSGRTAPPQDLGLWNVVVTVSPDSRKLVEGAFIDVPDVQQDLWARVKAPGSEARVLKVIEAEEPVPVQIPESVC